MLSFALYVSNHGFGHASRISALAEEFGKFGVFCHIICTKPNHLFNNLDSNRSMLHHRDLDFGVVHTHNLQVDLIQTRAKLLNLFLERGQIVAREVDFLRMYKIDLVIGDVPFFAGEAASYAGIPYFVVSNFDWHFIYIDLFKDDKDLKPVINCIYGLYQLADYIFRLPFSTKRSMGSFRGTERCGLLARTKLQFNDVRNQLGISVNQRILLVMFGGEGALEFGIEELCSAFKGTVLSTSPSVEAANHLTVSTTDDFTDLMHNTDIVLCKPGYSTLAEAVQEGKYIIYCPRNNYPEESALIAGLKHYPNCLQLPSLNLNAAQWKRVFKSIQLKTCNKKLFQNHNADVAGRILKRFIQLAYPKAKLQSVFDLGTNNLNYALFDLTSHKLIHKAHRTTGLGRNFTRRRLDKNSIHNCQAMISPLLQMDSHIQSEKTLLATGVSRLAANTDILSKWFDNKHKLQYNIISEKEEIRYVYHAVKEMGKGEEVSLAFDIGGASTEFVMFNGTRFIKGFSLPIGLLRLSEDHKEYDAAYKTIDQQLKTLNADGVSNFIGIGLTIHYLSRVLYESTSTNTNDFNGKVISYSQLNDLLQSIQLAKEERYLPYLINASYLPILMLGIHYCMSILKAFGGREITVFSDGISVGYAKWKSSKVRSK